MRATLPVLLLMLAGLPLQAWEPPSQNEMAALRGVEPYATALENGVPLPPTRDDARAAAGYRYEWERLALKRALVFQTSRAKSDRNRITADNYRATAAMARCFGAPELFVRYQEMLASDTISRRTEYAVRQALQSLVRDTYGIDILYIRYISEALDLPPAQHTLYMLQMPLHALYNMVPADLSASRAQLLADMQTMTQVLRMANETLLKVTDRNTADAAALELQKLLPLWSTTTTAQVFLRSGEVTLTPAENLALQLLETTTSAVYSTRHRLAENKWFGSSRLRVVDETLR